MAISERLCGTILDISKPQLTIANNGIKLLVFLTVTQNNSKKKEKKFALSVSFFPGDSETLGSVVSPHEFGEFGCVKTKRSAGVKLEEPGSIVLHWKAVRSVQPC